LETTNAFKLACDLIKIKIAIYEVKCMHLGVVKKTIFIIKVFPVNI
jgi:hypothetical protein